MIGNMYQLKICHLYSDLLNLYGDRGNVITLLRRCMWRGIEVTVENISVNDSFDNKEYDIVFLGGGQDFEQSVILNDLLTKKGDSIKKAIEDGVVFLSVCGGYQMLGKYYIDVLGNKMDCLGAIDIVTLSGQKRLTGNVICKSTILHEKNINDVLVGFENHAGRTFLGEGVKPLAIVAKGYGNNGEDKTEGAIYKNAYCTYMHGSFLPKNPKFADYLIATALKRKYGTEIALAEIDEYFENNARKRMKTCK